MKRTKTCSIITGWAACPLLLMLTTCNAPHAQGVDELNDRAYASHYRNLDSARIYADKAYGLTGGYDVGKAEASDNLVLVDLMKMHFTEAYAKFDSVLKITDNQVELLVINIQFTRLCQRESFNKEFYDYCERAQRRIHRTEEDEKLLSPRQRRRMVYVRSEFVIVTPTYYYHIGLEQSSIKAISQINPDGEIQTDMAQFSAYYYDIGSGGIINTDSQKAIE